MGPIESVLDEDGKPPVIGPIESVLDEDGKPCTWLFGPEVTSHYDANITYGDSVTTCYGTFRYAIEGWYIDDPTDQAMAIVGHYMPSLRWQVPEEILEEVLEGIRIEKIAGGPSQVDDHIYHHIYGKGRHDGNIHYRGTRCGICDDIVSFEAYWGNWWVK